MNRVEATLFITFAALWVGLFGLYHLMIAAVNHRVGASGRIPHVRRFGNGMFSHGLAWKALRREYNRAYPNGQIDVAMFACTTLLAATAIAIILLRAWEYTRGQLR